MPERSEHTSEMRSEHTNDVRSPNVIEIRGLVNRFGEQVEVVTTETLLKNWIRSAAPGASL